MEKVLNVSAKYAVEIAGIKAVLKELESGRIYGFNGNCTPADGSLETNVDVLTVQLKDLLDKIEYGKASRCDNEH
ncbi:hypothetical protein GH808_00430 [Acetobacterium fimetarium]|uniref:Uncharacterized protein n=1 Tax=Acetobacterium fimetarium TaxID=52691 RepID=A0ABR6WQM4_9FIRM|nr:hypothetical protein [Acetobacterium fimetarium]MBC3802908.1 hypothetical protein [Acetobacterium fimetarium]